MDFSYVDYTIVQDGLNLTTESTIKIAKLENRRTRLLFTIEDSLAENARLYLAIQNPETERYHYEPLLYDGEQYYFIIGTSITYYPGRQNMLLVGVTPSFEIDNNITFDLTNAIYVSKEFKKIFVLDNFLSDDAVQLSMPTIDDILDNLVVLHDNTINMADQCGDDLIACNEDVEKCEELLTECQDILEQCKEYLSTIQTIEENVTNIRVAMNREYDTYISSMRSLYAEYVESLQEGGGA